MKKLLITICVSFTFLASALIIPTKAETVSLTCSSTGVLS